ncbi:MAG: hypothetical protein CUN55_14390, partial [Phototrophicales bacterium]
LIALKDISKVIDTIRRSQTTDSARNNLIRKFKLSEEQAQAILDMRLRRLAALERRKLEEEYEATTQLIHDLNMLLASPKLMRMEIKRELNILREHYGDHRRTSIIDSEPADIGTEGLLMPREETYIALTQQGHLWRTYDNQMPVITNNESNAPIFLVQGTTADTLYLFTADGRAATVPVSQIPQSTETNGGEHYSRLSAFDDNESIIGMLSISSALEEGYVFFSTRGGEVKRIRISDLPALRVDQFNVYNVADDDQIFAVNIVFDEDVIMLITHQAQSISFAVEEVRPTGLAAGGMRGIRLKDEEDFVVGTGIVKPEHQVFVLTPDGRGKRSPLDEYPIQGRGGGGVRTFKSAKGQPNLLVGGTIVGGQDRILALTDQQRVLLLDPMQAPETKRDYRGDLFFTLNIGERITAIHPIVTLVEPPDESPLNEEAYLSNGAQIAEENEE